MGAHADEFRHDSILEKAIMELFPKNMLYVVDGALGESLLFFDESRGWMPKSPTYSRKTKEAEKEGWYKLLHTRLGKDPNELIDNVYAVLQSIEADLPDVIGVMNDGKISLFAEHKLWLSNEALDSQIKPLLEESAKRDIPFYLILPEEPLYSRKGYALKKAKSWLGDFPQSGQHIKLISYSLDKEDIFGKDPSFSMEVGK
jgi:hypothetical protein